MTAWFTWDVRIQRFWFRGSFPVTFHLTRNIRVVWTHIFGVQIGGWFVGVVRSQDE